jgi:hypothetical protein
VVARAYRRSEQRLAMLKEQLNILESQMRYLSVWTGSTP